MRKKDKILLLSSIAGIFIFCFGAYFLYSAIVLSGDHIAKKTNLLITDELKLLYSREIGEWRGGSVISIYDYENENPNFFDQLRNNNSDEEPLKKEKNNSFENNFINKLKLFKIPKKYNVNIVGENYSWYDKNNISVVHIPKLKRIIVQYGY